MGSCPGGEHEGPWALRHAELGRPVGYADTPLDDQQAMLGLHRTTNTPRWDSIGYAVLCYCPTRSVIKKYALAESLQRMSTTSCGTCLTEEINNAYVYREKKPTMLIISF